MIIKTRRGRDIDVDDELDKDGDFGLDIRDIEESSGYGYYKPDYIYLSKDEAIKLAKHILEITKEQTHD
jgi:hypothetical protein